MTIGTISLIIGVAFLILAKMISRNEEGSDIRHHTIDRDELIKEEPEFDRTWSFLPGNIFNRSKDD